MINWLEKLRHIARLPNVSLRPSALEFNEAPPIVEGLSNGTTVILSEDQLPEGVVICPKTINHTSCETEGCRACWTKDAKVAYLIHSIGGRSTPTNWDSDKMKAIRNKNKNQYQVITIGGRNVSS